MEIKPSNISSFEASVDTVNILSQKKIELTKEYCELNYGFNDYRLRMPQMIVVHFTVIPTLQQTIDLFKNDELASDRKYINKYSSLNVGIHYVIDKNGDIYSLMPDSVIARHIIGFNHVSLGIENIAATEDDLTSEQLRSNAQLIAYLTERYKSIRYVIGHDEYNDVSLPHYKLFKSLNATYQPYDKPDPGSKFMKDLRSELLSKYSLIYED